MEETNLLKLHKQYIEGTRPKEYVKVFDVLAGQITSEVKKSINIKNPKVYLTSKVMKHIYDRHCHDKGQDHVYLFLLENIHLIIKRPDLIRENRDSRKKRGEFVFIADIEGELYACPMEKESVRKGKKLKGRLSVVTAFKLKRKGRYLIDTKILFSKHLTPSGIR